MTEPAVVRDSDDLAKFLNGPTPYLIIECPPSRQQQLLQSLLPHLGPAHTVVFNVGKLACLEFAAQALECGCKLVETNTDVFLSTHRPVYLAGCTVALTEQAVEVLRPYFPHLLPAGSVEECALNDPGSVLGPVTLLLNLARVEQMGPYRTRHHDATESVARVVDALDRERCSLAAACGHQAHPLAELLGVSGSGAYHALVKSGLWDRHMSPDSVSHSHFLEEIPYTLAAWVELALASEVPVPHMQSVVTLAGAALGRELSARRSYLNEDGISREEPAEDQLLSLGLQETVTAATSGLKLTLSGFALEVETKVEMRPDSRGEQAALPAGDIAESFEKLRRALEDKVGRSDIETKSE